MKNKSFKRSLSVIMAVLMLMSCWVWVPGEHKIVVEAADNLASTINANKIAGFSEGSFATEFTTVTGKFHGDISGSSTYVTDANFKNQYKNILYSPAYAESDTALNSGWAANFTGISNIDSVRLWYPTTTMIYDGSTNPKMGVLFAVDAASGKQVGISNVYMSANANGLVMPEAYWHAKSTASSSPYYKAFAHLYLMYNVGASWISTSSGNDKTSTTSKGAWEVNASTIEYQGGAFGSGSTYYKAITPTWTVKPGNSVVAQNTIYVIDYVPLKNALGKCLEWYKQIKANPGFYTTKSVAEFVNVANALIAAKPNNFISSSNNNVTGWNSAVSSALSSYNSFKLEKRTLELTYENLFSLSDLVNSESIAIDGGGATASGSAITYDINAGTITAKTGGGEAFTSCNSGAGQYLLPVVAGTEYKLDYDVEYKGAVQTFVFFYNDAGQQVTVPGSSNYFYNAYSPDPITFTVPSGATKVGFRFGTYGDSGNYAKYSNIRLYETSREDIVASAKKLGVNRVVYTANDSIATSTIPAFSRPGYSFDCWRVKDVDNDGNGAWDPVTMYADGAYNMQQSFVIYSSYKNSVPFDVNYDNLFSFSSWAEKYQGNYSDGTIEVDTDAGTVYMKDTSSSGDDFYTNYGNGWYTMPVKPSTEYAFEFDIEGLEGSEKAQFFTFYYQNAQGSTAASTAHRGWRPIGSATSLESEKVDANGHFSGTFTTPDNCTYLGMRIGTYTDNADMTFKNIAIYEAANKAVIDSITNYKNRDVISDSLSLHTPTRTGYTFGGWVDANGKAVTADTLKSATASTSVFSTWKINKYTITFRMADGTTTSKEYEYGTTPSAPTNTSAYNDINGHHTFAWPTISPVTGSATYEEKETIGTHTEVTVAGKDATCTATGLTEGKKCSVCGTVTVEQTVIPAKGHTEVTVAGKDATCTATGLTEGKKCSVCGTVTVEQTVIPAKGHTEVTVAGKDATCEEAGLTEGKKCSVCGAVTVAQTEIPAKGHTEVTVAGKAATCTEAGLTEGKKCSVCGKVIVAQQEIPVIAHTEDTRTENEVNATCGADGSYDLVTYCSVCGTVISTEKKITTATGNHSYGTWSFYDENSHRRTCNNCTSYEEGSHDYSGEIRQVENSNFHEYKCKYCNDYGVESTHALKEVCFGEGTEFIKLDGNNSQHKEICKCGREKNDGHALVKVDGSYVAPTCEATGEQGWKCTECDYTYTETIGSLGHDYAAEFTVDKKASCTENGSKSRHCARCSSVTDVTEIKAREHHLEDDTVLTEATCLTDGEMMQKCTNTETAEYEACTFTDVAVIPATGHNMAADTVVAPTCTDEGYTVYKCQNKDCDYTENKDTVSSLGHSWSQTYTMESDGKDGKHYQTCTRENCGARTEAVGHIWSDGVINPDADCENPGVKTYTCMSRQCGATYTEVIPAKGHTAGPAATCTEAQTCTVCGEVLVDKLGHKEETVKGKDATCEETGLTDGVKCSVCGETLTAQKEIPAKGHTSGETVIENKVPATCTVDGSHDEVVYCTVCNKELSREKKTDAAPGHTPGAEATCTEAQICTVCDEVLVDKLGHKEETVKGKDATCEETGLTDGVKCSVCGETLTAQKEIPAKGHTEKEAVKENVTLESCGTDGYYDLVVYCSVCNEELSRTPQTVPATGNHNYATEVEGTRKPATCKETGSVTMQCGCGATEVQTLDIDENNHVNVVTDEKVEATCYATGLTEGSHCEDCGKVLVAQTVIEKKAHTPGEAVTENFNDSTCYAEGSYDEVVYCSVEACKAELSSTPKTISKKEHTPGEAVTENEVDSTCYAEGSYDEVVYCSVCATADIKEELSRETKTIAKKEHTPAEAVKENLVDSTCYAEGSYDEVVYCSVEACKAELSSTPKTISKKEHTYGEAVTENFNDSTCYAEGSYDEVVYCSVCAAADIKEELSRETKIIEKKAHTPAEAVKENVKAETCGVDGSYESVVYCSVCGAEISRSTVVVPATGAHTYTYTSTDDGEHEVGCENCDYISSEACSDTEGDKDCLCDKCSYEFEHKWNDGEITQSPTCTEKGVKTFTCTECDATRTEDVEADGHDYGEWKEEVPAICNKTGTLAHYECSVCHKYFDTDKTEIADITIEIEPNNHNWVKGETVAPTCTVQGHTNYKCSYCDSEKSDDFVVAKGHTEGEAQIENTVPATCTVDGSHDEVVYCTVCNKELSRENKTDAAPGHTPGAEATCTEAQICTVCKTVLAEALDHDYTSEVTTDPTCTESGIRTYTCNNDSTHTYTEVIDPLNHIDVNPVDGICDRCNTDICTHNETTVTERVEAECEKAGNIKYWTCNICEKMFSDEECKTIVAAENVIIPALNHKDTLVQVEAKTPTCTDIGWDAYEYCTACDYTTYAEKGALNHDIITDKAVAPTCTTTGLTEGSHCSRCNDATIEQKVVPALNHKDTLVQVEAKTPTCTEIGWDAYEYCTACDYTTYAEKEALNHDIITDKAVAPTCTTTGLTEGSHCSRCNDATIEQEVVPALNHKNTLVQVEAKTPTCTEIGWDAYEYCTACDYTTYAEKTALDHDIVIDKAVEPTCTTTGLTEGSHCSRCNDATVEQEVVPVKNHTPSEAVKENETPASCGNDGFYESVVYCSVCGNEISRKTVIIPADGAHVFVETGRKEATCKEPGVIYKTCGCGAVKTEIIPVNDNHIFENNWEIVVEPTCTKEGKEKDVCVACLGHAIERVIPVKEHNYKKTVVAPTCVNGGETIYTCKDCGSGYSADYTEALGHSYSKTVIAPTCENQGYTIYKCERCSDSYIGNIVKEAGHKDGDGDGLCDSCDIDIVAGCSCVCHLTSCFGRILYKIVRFIWKLIGIAPVCGCGHAHY